MSDTEYYSAKEVLDTPYPEAAGLAVELPPAVSSDQDLLRARKQRAEQAGKEAFAVLSGEKDRVGKSQELHLPKNRCWVVARGATCTHTGICHRWADCKTHTHLEGQPGSQALFHGFASLAEARAYLEAAKLPDTTLGTCQ